ncbi:uncharacterized protein LOC126836861 [Adelges cooleyi]|uniref:uncharacterized protein LOC126836861 n=1 Tax=Adelges cooleyi TaxID=133065 RepID=UPI0021806BA4|nr:uncharacterized protein LOC126836861 [Adelges cooleyi]
MGKPIDKFEILQKYFNKYENKKDEKMNLKLYSELFKYYCKERDISVQECAEEWKDERIIEDLFKDCLNWYNQDLEKPTRRISLDYFIKYMSKPNENDQITTEYFNDHKDKEKEEFETLHLHRFTELFQYHCNKKNISVKECAKDRKEAAIIKDSFNDCLKWTSQDLNYTRDYVTSDLFIYYMGGTTQDYEITDQFFEDHPSDMENKAKIYLDLYGELFKYHCESVYPFYTLRRCAEARKSQAILSDLKDIVR